VRRIEGESARKHVVFFSQLSSLESSAASAALVKRMNQPLLLKQKPVLTESEAAHVETYLNSGSIVIPGFLPGGLRMVTGHSERSGRVRTRGLRAALRKLIQERFAADFGDREKFSANEWIYEMDLVAGLRIRTYLDVGGWSSLNYSHLLLDEDGRAISPHLSLMQWLGASSMTRWDILLAEHLFDAADCVFHLSRHFVDEMKRVFAH
jgi:hypothetical protein